MDQPALSGVWSLSLCHRCTCFTALLCRCCHAGGNCCRVGDVQNVLLNSALKLPTVAPPPARGNRILVVCAMWTKYHSVYRNFHAYVAALQKEFEV